MNALTFKFSKDHGRLLENLVYLELRRRGKKIFYYKDGKECDFLVQEKDEKPLALQVCYSLRDPETRAREISGLVHACKKLRTKSGAIITLQESAEQKTDGINIRIIPAVKFLLGEF